MEKKIKILLVEDERMLAEILCDTLSDRDFDVKLAFDGAKALEILQNEKFEVIVSDIMMPETDGFTMVKKLRSQGCCTPILFLSARSATEDVVKGFGIGANDYLKKPFAIDELIVRIKALAGRNSAIKPDEVYEIGSFCFSPGKSSLIRNGIETKLAARENGVLTYLCRNMGKTVNASTLLIDLWGDDNFFNLRSLNVYITRLRHHFKEDPAVEIISERGVGYRIEARV